MEQKRRLQVQGPCAKGVSVTSKAWRAASKRPRQRQEMRQRHTIGPSCGQQSTRLIQLGSGMLNSLLCARCAQDSIATLGGWHKPGAACRLAGALQTLLLELSSWFEALATVRLVSCARKGFSLSSSYQSMTFFLKTEALLLDPSSWELLKLRKTWAPGL